MKPTLIPSLVLFFVITVFATTALPQTGPSPTERGLSGRPAIAVHNYRIEATLMPDVHEMEAAVTITFLPLESTDHIAFDLNENLYIQKVLNMEGIELEFEQGFPAPEIFSVIFPAPLETGTAVSIRVEYRGGFDRDRFSRMYSRDESSAYIGIEGSYLMYGAKWVPVNRFLGDRATATMELTVPLGMTVIGPGAQQSVITKGINETFVWNAGVPIPSGSIVAGQYFKREISIGDLTLECFATYDNLESIQNMAKTIAEIVTSYQEAYGPTASGNLLRLVEVDDRLSNRHGMLGTVFITANELSQPSPSVRDLARRIAYQWWRETIGVRSADSLWLEDGMAYYSAAEYLGKKYGPEAFKEEMNSLAILALKFESTSPVSQGGDLGFRTERYESVVAGKGAWILHMLHGLIGDVNYKDLIRQYIQNYAGRGGNATLFQQLAGTLYGNPIDWFFSEWVETTGVPDFGSDYVVYKTMDGFRVSGAVTQDQDLFRMPLEIALIGKDEKKMDTINLSGRSTPFDITSFSEPVKVVLDPGNRLLRNSPHLQTLVQLSLGDDRKAQGDYIGAVRAYENALKIDGQRSLVHFRLAEVFYEQFNLQAAANSFRDSLNGDLEPKWVEVWCYIYLGKIYDILGQRQRAMAEYTKAVNTKDDTNGAQAEAKKWQQTPFTRERTILGN